MTAIALALILIGSAQGQDAKTNPVKVELLLPRPSFQIAVEQRKSKAMPSSRDTVFVKLSRETSATFPASAAAIVGRNS